MSEKKRLILVVDDEETNRKYFSVILEGFGYGVMTTKDGSEAMAIIEESSPDLILLDIMMPEMDGFEVCSRLRMSQAVGHIPIVIMTSLTDRESRLMGLKCGADDFISKPADATELMIKISNLLKIKEYEETLQRQNELLEDKIRERTEELSEAVAKLQAEINERQVVEDKNLELIEFSSNVLDSMRDSLSIIDVKDYRIISANRAFMNEYGIEDESGYLGRTCYELTHGRKDICCQPDDICPLKETVETGRHVSVEHVHYDSEGSRRYVEVSTSPFRDSNGRISKVVHITRDITERRLAEKAIADSEKRFREFIDSSMDMIYHADADGVIRLVNYAGARLFGYESPEQMIGRKAEEFWSSADDRKVFVEQIMKSGIVRSYPMLAKRADNTLMELEATSRVVLNDEGIFSGIEGIIRDVTERKKAERELKIKYEELNLLFDKVESIKKEWESSIDSTKDMIVLIDENGRIKRCNRSFRDFSDREYESLLYQDWNQLLDQLGIRINAMGKNGAEILHEPSNRWFQLSLYPFKYADGKDGAVITIHDISEIKNATEALEITNQQIESNRLKLETALDEIADLIQQVTSRKDFSVRFSNPNLKKCYEIMGCNKTECPCYGIESMRCWQIAGTLCGAKVQGEYAEKYGNCMDCANYRFATSDPVYQIGENFNNMMHILELQHKELEKAYNELKIAQSQITQQEKMASIGQLAAGIAHEINNPTGFIMSNLGSLQKYADKLSEFIRLQDEALKEISVEQQEEIKKQKKALKVDFILQDIKSLVTESLDGAERIKKIVQDLKSFSRVDEAELKMADINAGLESTVNIVWNELKYKAKVTKDYGDIPHTKCNPGQLNQVFMNMLVNAAHAIEKQGEIVIRTWQDNGMIKVSISDTGCGIPKDNLDRIFEPFFTTKDVGKGTGLGLSIAYDIVKKHNGKIDVESEVGSGTTFIVSIPVVEG